MSYSKVARGWLALAEVDERCCVHLSSAQLARAAPHGFSAQRSEWRRGEARGGGEARSRLDGQEL
jgi:hypothetical protein